MQNSVSFFFWNVLEPPFLILKYVNLTSLMRYLVRETANVLPLDWYTKMSTNNPCNGFLGFCGLQII